MNRIDNILITSAGRRVSLLRNFQKTLKKFNPNGKVFAVDLVPELSAACQVADGYIAVKRVTEEQYLDELLRYCKDNEISLVVPTIDTELSILAAARDGFAEHGIRIVISDKALCDVFYLKSSTFEFFKNHDIDTPRIYECLEDAQYPLFAKLDDSSSSIGAGKVYNRTEAFSLLEKNKNYIFQELVEGDEYTCDAFFDHESRLISVVPRKRLEVRAGEVSKALAVKDEAIIASLCCLAGKLAGAYGTLTIQLIKTRDGRIRFIEINPRFGGGYPLSYRAGADFAEFLIRDYLGEKLDFRNDWQDGTLMLRYDDEVIVSGGLP